MSWCSIRIVAHADGTTTPMIAPMGNFIHVEPLIEERQRVTAGGLFLPDKAAEKPSRARVIAVGPGQRTDNGAFVTPLVQPGDIVRIVPDSYMEVTFKDLGDTAGKQYLIMYGDILAVEQGDLLADVKQLATV